LVEASSACNKPGWLKELLAWSKQPCPADVWIYRGQPARFPIALPGFLRPSHRALYGNRLHGLDTSLVRLLMERTHRLTAKRLFGHEMPVLPQPLGPSPLATVGGAGGPFDFAPTQAEVTAALAQHYGLPTFYLDVSFDVTVSAFFATHEWVGGAYRPSEEPGRVFRWPARRRTPLVLEIDDPGRPHPAIAFIDAMFTGRLRDVAHETIEAVMRDAPARTLPGLRVIDLASMDTTVRRPRAQQAALACPLYLDGNPLAAEWLAGTAASTMPTSLDELRFSDMSQLPGVEVMDLPGAGAELQSATGVSEAALFPDRIDLGHSFFTVAALLSIVSFGSPDDEVSAPESSTDDFKRRQLLKQHLERGLKAAAALIARESFRLLPGFPADSLRSSPSLTEAGDELRSQAAIAVQASRHLGSREAKEGAMLAAQELRRNRFAMTTEFCRSFEQKTGIALRMDPEKFYSPPPSAINVPEIDHTWVADEIRRRLERVEQVLADASRIPAYAVVDPALLAYDPSLFPTDPEYETTVREQASALQHWLGAEPFAHDLESL
jgi:hypothetical protein